MVQQTEEQQAAVDKFLTGRPLKITAFAGAGKTTTLRMLAEASPAYGVYLAFGKAIAAEAQSKFPKSVDCRTTHSIAFRAVVPHYDSAAKMTETLNARRLAAILAYTDRTFPGSFRLDGVQQAHLVLSTVRRFCQSSDLSISLEHVPKYGRLLGVRGDVVTEMVSSELAPRPLASGDRSSYSAASREGGGWGCGASGVGRQL
jgi:hypothetical protein